MKFSYFHGGKTYSVDLQISSSEFSASIGGRNFPGRRVARATDSLQFELAGKQQGAIWSKLGREIWIHWKGQTFRLEKTAQRGGRQKGQSASENILRAPMPGQVRKVLVSPGQSVKAGETLLVIEAMKMEIRIQAPSDSKVVRVEVTENQPVEREQSLVELVAG